MKRFQIDQDLFVQDLLYVEGFSNKVTIPSKVLEAVDAKGKSLVIKRRFS